MSSANLTMDAVTQKLASLDPPVIGPAYSRFLAPEPPSALTDQLIQAGHGTVEGTTRRPQLRYDKPMPALVVVLRSGSEVLTGSSGHHLHVFGEN